MAGLLPDCHASWNENEKLAILLRLAISQRDGINVNSLTVTHSRYDDSTVDRWLIPARSVVHHVNLALMESRC